MSNSLLKRTCIQLFLVGLSISLIYLFLNRQPPTSVSTTTTVPIPPKSIRTPPRAYIIAADCRSIRYNATKQNIERAFPNFFHISCFPTVSLNDSRIHTSSSILFQKWSSNQLAFIDLWTSVIPKYSTNNDEFDWSFIFEDDVNFCEPSIVSLPNFIAPLKELMQHPVVQRQDGFFYLGICGPEYSNSSPPIVSTNTKEILISKKGYGFCLHASGITAKRARVFWGEISSYRPNTNDKSLDYQLREYSMRSQTNFYTFGTNFHYPPGTGHFGIAFQDRGRFWSSIT